jgi:uncharacterized protein (TIGR03067 family)
MLNRMLCVFAACSFAAVTALADDKSANDDKSLQGTWQAVYLEANGEQSPDDQVKELKIVFKGYQVFAVKPEGEGQKCKFKLGTSKTLNTIDLTPIDGKGKTATGIYSLKGGQLKLCINLFGKDTTQRPTVFKTRAGDGVGFAILERVADGGSANDVQQGRPVVFDAPPRFQGTFLR